ncbi:glycosyltransferase family 2 protein [Gluconobacter morbifer]|uniref:glycosyltransferase family 2 protein n=1 Tax=Gluconobacter morbifer TaxID=479935 RepID=UPI001FE1CE3D|nr:glycosyltransferase family 2 protein [Gluconobacter morbifer]
MHVGFQFAPPDQVLDGKTRKLTFKSRVDEITLIYNNQETVAIDFEQTLPEQIFSFVDGNKAGALCGWVVSGNRVTGMNGGRDLLVTCGGEKVGQISADRYRGDVGKVLSCDPYCGFQFVPPPLFRKSYPQEFHFYVLPEMKELDNSPYFTSFVSDKYEGVVLDVVDQIDALHAQLTQLRRQVRAILPQPGYTLADYHGWATEYFPILRRYVDRTRVASTKEPLVSVICPVWRPDLSDFRAAVESVINQTWKNWELIIVDDCSKDEELRKLILEFVDLDPRIQVIFKETNDGISGTTNVGLENAKGEWIAFFDHDDLLVDVAIEYMMREAERSQADILYSDEDKIDRSGYYTNPSFKTDWNYRLLLGVNYVCHFVMAKKSLVDKVGGLNKKYDGAQDHDFLLRVSETIPARKIHHVPEILYHWRITAKSTAADIGNKSYAVDAGVQAVSDHLARRGLPAEVTSQLNNTLYVVNWTFTDEPKVTIIVPYKDEIATTKRCLDAIVNLTAYKNYDVILIDNWSITKESKAFAKAVEKLPNVQILTLKEKFNYSRLNNKAAALSDADFVLFLNNDVFVEQENWLNILVNEALADQEAAIVGGKFVYPNQTVQHAGVLLGIGDVAGHAHIGIPRDEGGYAGRAYFPQEMSAVTAAGMLVRKPAFDMVGGFDEENLTVAFNDIDLCLKIRDAGFKVLWTPDFCAEHHESLSRGSDDRPTTERRFFHETQYMLERWGDRLQRDPFYNPHFALDRQVFFDLIAPGVDVDRYPPLPKDQNPAPHLWSKSESKTAKAAPFKAAAASSTATAKPTTRRKKKTSA